MTVIIDQIGLDAYAREAEKARQEMIESFRKAHGDAAEEKFDALIAMMMRTRYGASEYEVEEDAPSNNP